MKTIVKELYTDEIDIHTGQKPKRNPISDRGQLMTRRLLKLLNSDTEIRELPSILASELIENINQLQITAACLSYNGAGDEDRLREELKTISRSYVDYRDNLTEIEVSQNPQSIKNQQLRGYIRILLADKKKAKKEFKQAEIRKRNR